MEFSRREYWSGLPFPSPGDLPNVGIEPLPLISPVLAGGFFTLAPPGEVLFKREAGERHPVRRKWGPYKEYRLFNPDFTEQLTSKRLEIRLEEAELP